jgi:hypothetical protein
LLGEPVSTVSASRLCDRPTPRLRRLVGTGEFTPFSADFTTLQAGQVVEVQWKKEALQPRFSWWLALVESVRGPDTVVLEFPQYGEGRTLSHLATVSRLSETEGLHGGVGGGLRVPTASELRQWGQV